jgi:hypothetical protein
MRNSTGGFKHVVLEEYLSHFSAGAGMTSVTLGFYNKKAARSPDDLGGVQGRK